MEHHGALFIPFLLFRRGCNACALQRACGWTEKEAWQQAHSLNLPWGASKRGTEGSFLDFTTRKSRSRKRSDGKRRNNLGLIDLFKVSCGVCFEVAYVIKQGLNDRLRSLLVMAVWMFFYPARRRLRLGAYCLLVAAFSLIKVFNRRCPQRSASR